MTLSMFYLVNDPPTLGKKCIFSHIVGGTVLQMLIRYLVDGVVQFFYSLANFLLVNYKRKALMIPTINVVLPIFSV